MSTAPSEPSGPTGQLCNCVHSIKIEDVPNEPQIRAKYLILDGIACAIVGSHLPWSETAANAIYKFEPEGSCTIIGWGGKKLAPLSAALLNSTFIQGFELNDYHMATPLHSNSILLPAVMAAFQQSQASGLTSNLTGSALLLSYIIGCEVGTRVVVYLI